MKNIIDIDGVKYRRIEEKEEGVKGRVSALFKEEDYLQEKHKENLNPYVTIEIMGIEDLNFSVLEIEKGEWRMPSVDWQGEIWDNSDFLNNLLDDATDEHVITTYEQIGEDGFDLLRAMLFEARRRGWLTK